MSSERGTGGSNPPLSVLTVGEGIPLARRCARTMGETCTVGFRRSVVPAPATHVRADAGWLSDSHSLEEFRDFPVNAARIRRQVALRS